MNSNGVCAESINGSECFYVQNIQQQETSFILEYPGAVPALSTCIRWDCL